MSQEYLQKVGRGGAGNFYSNKDPGISHVKAQVCPSHSRKWHGSLTRLYASRILRLKAPQAHPCPMISKLKVKPQVT
jgi:hypothetical protein